MIEAIGERQLAIAFDIESRLLHSIERNPPVLTEFATRPWQAAWFTDLVARDVAKDICSLVLDETVDLLLFQPI